MALPGLLLWRRLRCRYRIFRLVSSRLPFNLTSHPIPSHPSVRSLLPAIIAILFIRKIAVLAIWGNPMCLLRHSFFFGQTPFCNWLIPEFFFKAEQPFWKLWKNLSTIGRQMASEGHRQLHRENEKKKKLRRFIREEASWLLFLLFAWKKVYLYIADGMQHAR